MPLLQVRPLSKIVILFFNSAAIDPVIWKQANLENPDKEKMIPVPMMGFKSLNQRLQLQNQMTEGHQNRNDIIQKEIRKLQVRYDRLFFHAYPIF